MSETAEQPTSDRWAEFAANDYARQVQRVVAELQELAERVGAAWRVQPKRGTGDDKPDHTWHASQLVHAIQQGVSGLPLSRLIESASEADRAARA